LGVFEYLFQILLKSILSKFACGEMPSIDEIPVTDLTGESLLHFRLRQQGGFLEILSKSRFAINRL